MLQRYGAWSLIELYRLVLGMNGEWKTGQDSDAHSDRIPGGGIQETKRVDVTFQT